MHTYTCIYVCTCIWVTVNNMQLKSSCFVLFAKTSISSSLFNFAFTINFNHLCMYGCMYLTQNHLSSNPLSTYWCCCSSTHLLLCVSLTRPFHSLIPSSQWPSKWQFSHFIKQKIKKIYLQCIEEFIQLFPFIPRHLINENGCHRNGNVIWLFATCLRFLMLHLDKIILPRHNNKGEDRLYLAK